MTDRYSDELARFKAAEKPEPVLIVADDNTLTRIAVAWPTVSVEQRGCDATPQGDSEHECWDWLWRNCRYSQTELAERTGIRGDSLERKMRILIGNRVLYPDGTVNSFVQRYLREKVLKLFGSKPRKTT